jgi:4-hydroxyphenylpyruvate dioxygenase-like putative hemolysin
LNQIDIAITKRAEEVFKDFSDFDFEYTSEQAGEIDMQQKVREYFSRAEKRLEKLLKYLLKLQIQKVLYDMTASEEILLIHLYQSQYENLERLFEQRIAEVAA